MAEAPVFALEVSNGSALVEVADGHGSLVGLVINSLSSKEPLSLLTKSFKNVVGAHFHNRDLLVEAGVLAVIGGATLVLSNLSVATTRNHVWLESHEFGVLHVGVAHGTILVTERLTLSIAIPLIVILVVSVILVESIVEVTVDPAQLRNVAEVEGNLSDLTVRLEVIVLTERIQLLVSVGVHDLVAPLVVRLGLVNDPLGGRRMIKVEHF